MVHSDTPRRFGSVMVAHFGIDGHLDIILFFVYLPVIAVAALVAIVRGLSKDVQRSSSESDGMGDSNKTGFR